MSALRSVDKGTGVVIVVSGIGGGDDVKKIFKAY